MTQEKVEVREIHHYHKHDEYWENRLTKALSLITVGLILLMNTTGVLPWIFWWEFIKFWPAFIISAGISLVLSFSRATRFIADAIGFLIFLLIVFFAAVNTGSSAFTGLGIVSPQLNIWPFGQYISGNEQTNHEDVLKKDLPEAKILNLFVQYPVGMFTMSGMSSDNVIFSKDTVAAANFRFSSSWQPVGSDQTLYYHVDLGNNNPQFNWGSGPSMVLKVSNSYESIFLNAKFGAGSSVLNFNNALKSDTVKVETGAGQLDINIDQDSVPKSMDLKVGAGKMTVNLPAVVGYILDYKVGVGDVRVDNKNISSGFGSNQEYRSSNWDTADIRITIKVEVGVGEFSIISK